MVCSTSFTLRSSKPVVWVAAVNGGSKDIFNLCDPQRNDLGMAQEKPPDTDSCERSIIHSNVTPPPPPPPPFHRQQPSKGSSPPRPAHAAIPWSYIESPPIQETGDSPEAPHDSQVVSDSSPLSEQSQEDSLSDFQEACHPEQETDPAPQALDGQQRSHNGELDAQDVTQTNESGEDQLS